MSHISGGLSGGLGSGVGSGLAGGVTWTGPITAACSLDSSPKANWVEKKGGLPDYVCRIAKHLIAKGMSKQHAIATAINVVKRMCKSGDLNYPGIQQANAASRAEACAAVARWESMKG